MNELQKVFKYSDIEVRTVTKDGEPWFIVKDVCNVLEIVNSRDAISGLDKDDVGSTYIIDSLGRKQNANIVKY